MESHNKYISRCLQLAKLGAGKVAPNPMVGCVIVLDGKIIGEGYHKYFGGSHAEVNAINSVKNKDLLKNAILYASLEPCSHWGKTPPCSDLIIENKIKTVVIGCKDSFEKVNGKGIEKLKAAGINVIEGIWEKTCVDQNKFFFSYQNKKRPYIILKWAQSEDLFIGKKNEANFKITSNLTDIYFHKLRSEVSAIMVGTNTARVDNPSLKVRKWTGSSPLRITIDLKNELDQNLKIFSQDTNFICIKKIGNTSEISEKNFLFVKEKETSLIELMPHLFEIGKNSLLVEGGSELIESFIKQGLWDEAIVITNKKLKLKEGLSAPKINKHPSKKINLGEDQITYYNNTI